jgi:hypothetical protein
MSFIEPDYKSVDCMVLTQDRDKVLTAFCKHGDESFLSTKV